MHVYLIDQFRIYVKRKSKQELNYFGASEQMMLQREESNFT